MTLSREQKIAKARKLRAQGWTAPKIAASLSANESTVRNWYLGKTCDGCGVPVDGSSGKQSSERCPRCANDLRVIWTRETVVESIRRWASKHGSPPSAYDWHPAIARSRGSRFAEQITRAFEDGHWPSTPSVMRVFGSWNAAMAAAGFVPRRAGVRLPSKHRAAA